MSAITTFGGDLGAPDAVGRVNDAIIRCAHIMLRRVFRIMRACGFSENELRDMAIRAVNEVEMIADSRRSKISARQAMMCCDVVLKWRRDCTFLDNDGAPAPLPFHGGIKSFSSLVRASVPNADPLALLATMIELGAVRASDQNTIELISNSVVTCSGQDGLAIAGECVLEHICGFLGSVEFNVFDKPSRAKGRFERACYASVPKELVPVLQQLVSARGQDFVDVIDEWLTRRATQPVSPGQGVLVGAGAYVFVREEFE
jgi:hypothetical protein